MQALGHRSPRRLCRVSARWQDSCRIEEGRSQPYAGGREAGSALLCAPLPPPADVVSLQPFSRQPDERPGAWYVSQSSQPAAHPPAARRSPAPTANTALPGCRRVPCLPVPQPASRQRSRSAWDATLRTQQDHGHGPCFAQSSAHQPLPGLPRAHLSRIRFYCKSNAI